MARKSYKKKGGIKLGGKGGFDAGIKEKAFKIPKEGLTSIGHRVERKKNWTPKYSI